MGSREEAEDMLQEAFTDCFTRIGTYRTDSTFGAWLKSIVINRCISRLRKREADLVYIDDYSGYEMQEEQPAEALWPDPAAVTDAIQQLPEGYRIIFSLYLLEGYDHQEISEILDISESTSKTQYMRAKAKLRQILAEMRVSGGTSGELTGEEGTRS